MNLRMRHSESLMKTAVQDWVESEQKNIEINCYFTIARMSLFD